MFKLSLYPFSFVFTHAVYHNDRRSVAGAFRTQIISAKLADRCPVKTIGSVSFMFVRHEELFLVAVTKQNAHAALVFEFLHKLIFLLKSYFDGRLAEESLKENFALVYELLDEIVDFGYPQNCEPAVLKQIITTGGMFLINIHCSYTHGELSSLLTTIII